MTLKDSEYQIIQTIQEHGKTLELPPSTYEIAEKLNKHQPSIYRQLKRWKRGNVILGYSLKTTYWEERYIHAYIQVKAPLGKYQIAIDFCHQDTHVIDCFRTNHEYSLLIKTRHSTLTDLNVFLKALYQETKVTDTITHIILDGLRA
jgi:DNA-binding Lrp family transcriptional regulator